MTRDEAREKLLDLTLTIGAVVAALRTQLPLIEQYLKEARDMDSFGHIVNPTLFLNSERKATDAILRPICKAAAELVRVHDLARDHSKAVLEKVRPK